MPECHLDCEDGRIVDGLSELLEGMNYTPRPTKPAPYKAIPGSPEKIQELARRFAAGEAMHHDDDPKMPMGYGWEIQVEPNGRVIHKRLVALATGEVVGTVETNEQTGEQQWRR